MNKELCASIFVINPETKKILLVKHKEFKKWVQPGGHLDHNETPEEAAAREVYEETQIKVRVLGERFPREEDFIRPLGIQKNRRTKSDGEMHMHVDIIYAAIPNNDVEVTLNAEESDDIRWFSRNELENINCFPDIKITMDYILTNIIK